MARHEGQALDALITLSVDLEQSIPNEGANVAPDRTK